MDGFITATHVKNRRNLDFSKDEHERVNSLSLEELTKVYGDGMKFLELYNQTYYAINKTSLVDGSPIGLNN